MLAILGLRSATPRCARCSAALACLLALAVAFAAGCGTTRVVRTPVYEKDRIEAFLRGYEQGGQAVARGFAHPAVVAPVRLAHILAFVDVEMLVGKERRRLPAVDPGAVYEVAEALSAALEQADPSQEVVVRAVRQERSLGIFHKQFLTSFVAYVKGDLLTLHFGHVDWEVPKMGAGTRDELPEPKEGVRVMDFRVVPDSALVALGPQSVGAEWRSERFREPERIQVTPGGQVLRRTILLESAPEEGGGASPAEEPLPQNLSPETLRALAELEEQRRAGQLSEAEYQSRRRALLGAAPEP